MYFDDYLVDTLHVNSGTLSLVFLGLSKVVFFDLTVVFAAFCNFLMDILLFLKI
jgi:hypothetical protein